MYIVGKKRGLLLEELGLLNLKGELHMKQLERVTSVMDAKNANMSNKHLTELLLSWNKNEESQSQKNVEQILEVLQPHPEQLQTLGVGGYRGVHFPKWMGNVDWESCLHLSSLARLPCLKTLEICNMNNVKYVDDEAYNGGVAGGFIALEFLILDKLPNVLKISREEGENILPRLSMLQMTKCPKLLALPCLPSIKELKIGREYNQDLLSSIHKLHSLESLQLGVNEELTCFPDGMLRDLPSLKILIISGCSKLEVLTTDIINLNAVQQLCIEDCDNLESFTDQVLQGLHSLKRLQIIRSREFKLSPGFQYLTSFENLTIEGCPKVEGFPEALQHMTALQSLMLCRLRNLGSLPVWLGNLGLLRSLHISNCPKLTCLPMSFQCLSGLKSLEIHSCPELEKRFEKETGEDWPKIAHVLDIFITRRSVRCLSRLQYYAFNHRDL